MSDKLPDDAPWTAFDERNLILEINEDRRLRDLGIDPDMDPFEILRALLKLEEDDGKNKPEQPDPIDDGFEDFSSDWH